MASAGNHEEQQADPRPRDLTYEVTTEGLVDVQLRFQERSKPEKGRLRQSRLVAAALWGLLASIGFEIFPDSRDWGAIAILASVLIAWFSWPYRNRRRLNKRMRRAMKDSCGSERSFPITFKVSPKYVRIEMPDSSVEYNWTTILSIQSVGDAIEIAGKSQFIVIRDLAFTDNEDRQSYLNAIRDLHSQARANMTATDND